MIIDNIINEKSLFNDEAKEYFIEYKNKGDLIFTGYTYGNNIELFSDIIKDLKVFKDKYKIDITSCRINGKKMNRELFQSLKNYSLQND